jgi:hypothetical protein
MIINVTKFDVARIVGLILVGIGFLFALLDLPICSSICQFCVDKSVSPCHLLLLFVGIIFIVDGASIVLIYTNNEKDLVYSP